MHRTGPQDTPNHWARIEERGVYAGLRLMMGTYRTLGKFGFSVLLFPVISYFFLAGTEARRASRTFLSRVYDDPQGRKILTEKPGWRHSFRHFFNFGEAVLDKLAAWAGDLRSEDIVYENRKIFDALQESGRGGLLIASHLGNMEVCRALGQLSIGLKLNVLVHTKHAPNFNRLLRDISPEANVSLIQTTEVDPATAMILHDRVARGEFVVIVGDRTPATQSARISWAPFLRKMAPFPQGPFILASLLECPVQLIFCLKQKNQFNIIFEHFADAIKVPRRERAVVLDRWITEYATRLEYYCVRFPYQWFNFFDFWGQAGTMAPTLQSEASLKD